MLKEIFTTYEIAKLCHVDVSTVSNWIDAGKIVSYKTPGGHRRVNRNDLYEFLELYQMPVKSELRAKILIVDDEKDIGSFLKKLIKKSINDADIEMAYDGYEAGKKIMSILPDLIVLDLRLPGVDGYKILEDIKKNKKLRRTRIIAISGDGGDDSRKRVLDSGADEFFPKPIETDKFIESVSYLLGKQRG